MRDGGRTGRRAIITLGQNTGFITSSLYLYMYTSSPIKKRVHGIL